jgi:hypothetical protein
MVMRTQRRLIATAAIDAPATVIESVFAKYVRHAHLPEIPLSFNDATRARSSQVNELVRYVEQSNPIFVQVLVPVSENRSGNVMPGSGEESLLGSEGARTS